MELSPSTGSPHSGAGSQQSVTSIESVLESGIVEMISLDTGESISNKVLLLLKNKSPILVEPLFLSHLFRRPMLQLSLGQVRNHKFLKA